MRQFLWSITIPCGLFLIAPAVADAQVVRYPAGYGQTTSWGSTTPTSPWVTYTPGGWNGYAPPAPVAVVAQPIAPAAGMASPTSTAPPSGVAWQGYVASGGYARPVTVVRNRNEINWFGRMPGGAYREFGSGRPVPLAKPWLPGSP